MGVPQGGQHWLLCLEGFNLIFKDQYFRGDFNRICTSFSRCVFSGLGFPLIGEHRVGGSSVIAAAPGITCWFCCFSGPGAETQQRLRYHLQGGKVRESKPHDQQHARGEKATWGQGPAPVLPVGRHLGLSALVTFCIWLEIAWPVCLAMCFSFPIPLSKKFS